MAARLVKTHSGQWQIENRAADESTVAFLNDSILTPHSPQHTPRSPRQDGVLRPRHRQLKTGRALPFLAGISPSRASNRSTRQYDNNVLFHRPAPPTSAPVPHLNLPRVAYLPNPALKFSPASTQGGQSARSVCTEKPHFEAADKSATARSCTTDADHGKSRHCQASCAECKHVAGLVEKFEKRLVLTEKAGPTRGITITAGGKMGGLRVLRRPYPVEGITNPFFGLIANVPLHHLVTTYRQTFPKHQPHSHFNEDMFARFVRRLCPDAPLSKPYIAEMYSKFDQELVVMTKADKKARPVTPSAEGSYFDGDSSHPNKQSKRRVGSEGVTHSYQLSFVHFFAQVTAALLNATQESAFNSLWKVLCDKQQGAIPAQMLMNAKSMRHTIAAAVGRNADVFSWVQLISRMSSNGNRILNEVGAFQNQHQSGSQTPSGLNATINALREKDPLAPPPPPVVTSDMLRFVIFGNEAHTALLGALTFEQSN